MHLEKTQLAQWAQLMMDEGSFTYVRSSRPIHDIHHGRYWGYYPNSAVNKFDRTDIEYWAHLLGVKVKFYKTTGWRIHYGGNKLIRLLKKSKQYFRGVKKPQIETILTYGKFYIPYRLTKPPSHLSLVEPERLMKYLQQRVEITPAPPARYPPVTPEEREEIIRLHEGGLTPPEISQLTGYSRTTIYRILRGYRR